ncbi:MAG: hypothetical protein COA33_012460 [Fluviicola sp.]|nr:hypothetical protein [Fluviicola sp.]
MKIIATYLVLLISLNVYSQNGWEDCSLAEYTQAILDADSKIGPNQSYSFDSKYLFFTSLTINEPELTMYSSLICKKGKEIYLSQFGRLMYQNKLINIVCDTSDRKIILSDSKPVYFKRRSTSDFDLLLNSQCAVKKKKTKLFTKYYFEFAKNPKYLAAEIWIKNSGMVEKYILYTASEMLDDSQEKERLIQPRMEVVFSNYKIDKTVDKQKIKTAEDFIVITEGVYTPHENYEGFEIIDLRNSK